MNRKFSLLQSVIFSALLGACANDPVRIPKLNIPPRPEADNAIAAVNEVAPSPALKVADNPQPPLVAAKPAPAAAPTAAPAGTQPADVILNFDQLPLPAFIQATYATALKKNISIDPKVMERKDLVTLRSGKALTAVEAENTARLLLKSYGIAVNDIGGLIRIVPNDTNTGYLPEIRRGRALPDSPLPLRPVFQLVELQAVRNVDVRGYLTTLFGSKLTVTEDPGRNSLLLAGNGDDVQAALEAIQTLDQPMFKGRNSIRITPLIWSADELSKRLTEILTQEGYAVGTTASQGAVQFPITLLPVTGNNTLIVFAQSKEIINHILDWAQALDKPVEKSVGRNYCSYQVRNTDASRIAETIQQLLVSTPVRATTPAAAGAPAAGPTASAASPSGVVVDKANNGLLIRASGEDCTELLRLARDLDRPTKQVLIEVTVAEVTLSENITVGIDWVFKSLNGIGRLTTALNGNTSSGVSPNIGSTTGTGTGSGGSGGGTGGGAAAAFTGFIVSQLDGSGNPRAVLNALATNSNFTILSTPRVISRNGELANIQVGDEVPVLTSQQTSSATAGTGLISTIQYRNTGTLLKIRPVIHSSDQVDLEITQEVSSVNSQATGVGSSPVISKRALDSRLTLKHGSTYVLGGLITTDATDTDSGVPFLKDIPVVGYAFKKKTKDVRRKELILMVTPYILSDDNEARTVTEEFRKQFGWVEESAKR